MAGNKRIVHTLVWLRKTGDTAKLTKRMKSFFSPGEDFMHITLVTYVKQEPIPTRIINTMERHSELHDAEIGRQMTACL